MYPAACSIRRDAGSRAGLTKSQGNLMIKIPKVVLFRRIYIFCMCIIKILLVLQTVNYVHIHVSDLVNIWNNCPVLLLCVAPIVLKILWKGFVYGKPGIRQ